VITLKIVSGREGDRHLLHPGVAQRGDDLEHVHVPVQREVPRLQLGALVLVPQVEQEHLRAADQALGRQVVGDLVRSLALVDVERDLLGGR